MPRLQLGAAREEMVPLPGSGSLLGFLSQHVATKMV